MSLSLDLDDIFQAAALQLLRSVGELLRERASVAFIMFWFASSDWAERNLLKSVSSWRSLLKSTSGSVFFRDSSILGSGIIIQ